MQEQYKDSQSHKDNSFKARQLALQAHQVLKFQRIDQYNKNPKRCLNCNNAIEYKKKSTNKFCNSSCAAIYNNTGSTHSTKTKQKISQTHKLLTKISPRESQPKVKLVCYQCKNSFHVVQSQQHRKFCSLDCRIHFFKTSEGRAQRSVITRKCINDGNHQGWTTRKFEPSYPEKYFMKVLENDKISYTYEHKVGKYFIDFAIIDKMIALEIDGKQHTYPKHIERDRKKDEFLNSQGWQVFRIKWYNPTNTTAKEKLYPQIENFKQLIVKL